MSKNQTEINNSTDSKSFKGLVLFALLLSVITILYNIAEGLISIFFGLNDETLALFGFGLDSFVEVISGIGILHMIIRMKRNPISERDRFERTALKITGLGIVISLISILTMYALLHYKLKVGRALNSDAIIADANCTKTCFYLSFILLASSLSYEVFKIGYLDIAGSLGIAYFAFKEGKESIEKSNSAKLSCSCQDDCH